MLFGDRRLPDFTVSHDSTPGGTLLAGFSEFGLAGLTAVDFLVDHLDLEETGHITAAGLPSITPFADGKPRHPTRLYSRDDLDVTVLVGELYVPPGVAGPFSEAVLDWTEGSGVEEVAVLAGIPVAHGPEGHRAYYVASDDYRERRLGDTDIEAMGAGFLDGTRGALMERGLSSPLGVCVYLTPVHRQAPDVEAAVRLVDAVESVYDLGVDTEPLASFASEVSQYYRELASRLEDRETEEPGDRMYM
ncbi:proteasome assembly chaperone family protein [Halobium salinum]|uniref:Proteasome assembly chaperone family protein n=1 Tax=Halobium salinum TaxID=1364940 RepID=A0ABD5PEZ9_9EURY|nr:PAC2 family protein [Halobium salinum]